MEMLAVSTATACMMKVQQQREAEDERLRLHLRDPYTQVAFDTWMSSYVNVDSTLLGVTTVSEVALP